MSMGSRSADAPRPAPVAPAPAPAGFSFLARPSYRPSGRIDANRTAPLLATGILVALAMARVLLLAEADFYYFVVVPMFVGAPAFGAVFVAVRFGRCRNTLAGAALGLLILSTYYLGYWGMSYRAFLDASPVSEIYLRAVGGSSSPWGYFLMRCRTNTVSSSPGSDSAKEPGAVDEIFQYIFFGMEAALLLGLGTFVGYASSGGAAVYYERSGRWARSLRIRWSADHGEEIVSALDRLDWDAIARLPRLPLLNDAQAPGLEARLYYLEGAAEPVFFNLVATNVKNAPWIPPGAKGFLIQKTIAKMIRFDPIEARAIARAFPEMGEATARALGAEGPSVAGASAEATGATTPLPGVSAAVIPPASVAPERPVIEYAPGLKGHLQRAGLLSATVRGPEFRERAVAASLDAVRRIGSFARLDDAPISFCLKIEGPGASKEDLREAARAQLKLLVGVLVAIFLGLGTGAGAGLASESLKKRGVTTFGGIDAEIPLIVATCLGIATFLGAVAVFLFHAQIARRGLARRLLGRAGALFPRNDPRPRLAVGIEDLSTFHVRKPHPEDYGVLLIDERGRRLLIEGVTHRYQIRNADVLGLRPLQGAATPGVELRYSAGGEPLALAITTASSTTSAFTASQGGSAKSGSEALQKKLSKALGLI